MKHISLITILAIGTLAASAAVPLHWTVESSRTSLAQLEAYHGETLDIAATMQTYGKPLSLDGKTAVLYYQTNGMEQAWWSVNGTCSGSTARVTFTPAMDPGASILNLFLSVQDGGNNYRAHARLKMLGSPGADANVIEPPIVTLDFSRIGLILNAPYYTKAEAEGLLDHKADKTNTYTKAETEQKIQELAPTPVETDPIYTAEKEDLIGRFDDKADKTNTYTKAETDQIVSNVNKYSVQSNAVGYAQVKGLQFTDNDSAKAVSGDTTIFERKVGNYSWGEKWEAFGAFGAVDYSRNSIAVGPGSRTHGDDSLAIGFNASVNNSASVAIGSEAIADGTEVVAIGGNSFAMYSNSIAIGNSAKARHKDSIVVSDKYTVSQGTNTINFGFTDDPKRIYFKGKTLSTMIHEEAPAPGNYSVVSNSAIIAREESEAALSAANDANIWSSATFNFMTGGRTNCWFSGTNYVFGTDAAARTRFAWEYGMDAATVPCSMALWEIRDGVRQLVWDQRDWTVWYWSFKANQMQTNVTAQIAALGLAVTNDSNYAWAKRYASDGTPNPDASTTFIDTPSVTLSPGMKWETVATVSGAAYWTIVGDGAIIGGSGTNAVLRIQDFEGNDIMTVTKGEHRLAWIERGEITGQMYDGDGWVCFDMLADAEPIGYFSTTLDSSDFLPQTDPNCPAQYEWEDLHNGKYRIHYLLKPGIQSNACFAKFQVEVEGQTIIRYNAGQEISGGLIYNGVKIAPDISGSPAVGTVIQWKVVNR